MRAERWWWLIAFLVVSLCVHTLIGLSSKKLPGSEITFAKPGELIVELQPEAPEPPPKPKPEPKPTAEPKPKVPKEKIVAKQVEKKATTAKAPRAARAAAKPARMAAAKPAPPPKIRTAEPRPRAPKVNPGGLEPKAAEKPLPFGNPNGNRQI